MTKERLLALSMTILGMWLGIQIQTSPTPSVQAEAPKADCKCGAVCPCKATVKDSLTTPDAPVAWTQPPAPPKTKMVLSVLCNGRTCSKTLIEVPYSDPRPEYKAPASTTAATPTNSYSQRRRILFGRWRR